MKKLLCLLGLTVALPFAIAPEARACSTPIVIAQALPEPELSLVEAFAPPRELPAPTQPCHRQMDEVSRELVLAALRQADQIQDPAEKTEAILDLFWTYKHFELPSAWQLLDAAEQQSQQVAAASQRLSLLVDIAGAYQYGGEGDEAWASQQAELIEESWRILQTANTAELTPSEELHDLLYWYQQQGDRAKVDWLQEQVQKQQREQLMADGLSEAEATALIEGQSELDPITSDSSLMQLQRQIEELRLAIDREGPEALDDATITSLRQLLSQVSSEPLFQSSMSIELAQLLVQAQKFELARDVVYDMPLPQDYLTWLPAMGIELDENAIKAGLIMVGTATPYVGGDLAMAFYDSFPASDPNGPGLQAAARVWAAQEAWDNDNDDVAQELVDKATQMSRRLENRNHQAQVLMLAAAMRAEFGQVDEAQALIAEATAIAPGLLTLAEQFMMIPSEEAPNAGSAAKEQYYSLHEDFAEAIYTKDLARAEALAQQFEADWEQASLLVQLAGLQSQQQQPEKALQSLETAVENIEAADMGFEGMVDTMAYGITTPFGYAGGSITLLPQILELLPVDQVELEAIRLNALGTWYIDLNQPEATREVQALMEQIERLPNAADRTELWGSRLSVFATAGAWNEAIAHIAQLPSGLSQVQQLTDLAETYSEQATPLDADLQMQLQKTAQLF